jgi:ribonuclease-3
MRVSFSGSTAPLEESIEYTFRSKTLLKEALTHKSFSNEKENTGSPFNERLEFLGDAVLTLVISRYLYSAYPEYSESELSKIRAYVVRESSLADAAVRIDIGAYLRLGKGEEMTGGRQKSSLLANAFEALLGAIYLDGGIRKTEGFVIRHFKERISELASGDLQHDFKTSLQEVSQAQFGVLPRYVIEHEEGPEHRKTFEVKVFIKNAYYGSGRGGSKKAAAQRAAQAGLKKLGKIK